MATRDYDVPQLVALGSNPPVSHIALASTSVLPQAFTHQRLQLLETINAFIANASNTDLTEVQQSEALRTLTEQLQRSHYSALALITDTVAHGVQIRDREEHEATSDFLDICHGLKQAIETDQPFDFVSLSPNLTKLLLNDDADGQAPEAVTSTSIEADCNEAICPCTDPHVLQEFLSECLEHQMQAEQHLLQWEANVEDTESLHYLFCAMHSLKGASGVCDMDSMGRLAHLAESLLGKVQKGKNALSSDQVKLLLCSVDCIGDQLKTLSRACSMQAELRYPLPPASLIAAFTAAINEDCGIEASGPTLKHSQEARLPNPRVKSTEARVENHDSLRVDSDRLELLVDLIGELVFTETAIQQELDTRRTSTAVSLGTRLRKVVREVQQLSFSLKMVPVGSLFQKLNRLVYDLSLKLGKPAALLIEGGDTEVDKTLLECIAAPLTHLVRNALDHGIESPQERLAIGKSSKATIRVTAEHRAGDVIIRISDDGRGLDRKKILQRGIELGLVAAGQSVSDKEIDQLVFLPGFSTATNTTEVSGRGVGMDVVHRNIRLLRGSIQLESHDGVGTTISLRLPLTLSIIDGAVIRVGDHRFVIPTLAVKEQLQVDILTLDNPIEDTKHRYRGHPLELVHLGNVLGIEHVPCADRSQVCLVIQNDTQNYGLVVDEILGQQPVVIKTLGELLSRLEFYCGGAILSDGRIAFVLDVAAITRMIAKNEFLAPPTEDRRPGTHRTSCDRVRDSDALQPLHSLIRSPLTTTVDLTDVSASNETAEDSPNASSTDRSSGQLMLQLNGTYYGIPIENVREVITKVLPTPIPTCPESIIGIIQLGGRLLPIVDIRKCLGLPLATECNRPCYIRLITQIDGADVEFGMVADRVHRVVGATEPQKSQGPNVKESLLTHSQWCTEPAINPLVLLDVRSLAQQVQLDIADAHLYKTAPAFFDSQSANAPATRGLAAIGLPIK